MRIVPLRVAALCAALAAPAFADVVHDESVDGDLSNDRLNPTAYNLDLGTNSLLATSVRGDREFITLTVPAGMELRRIWLTSYESIDQLAFIAVQAGTQFTEDPDNDPNVGNMLGYTHFGPGAFNVGRDVLDDMAEGPGAIGFVPPLPAGDYTYWIQQTGLNSATYQFDYFVLPSPAAGSLLCLGALAKTRRRR